MSARKPAIQAWEWYASYEQKSGGDPGSQKVTNRPGTSEAAVVKAAGRLGEGDADRRVRDRRIASRRLKPPPGQRRTLVISRLPGAEGETKPIAIFGFRSWPDPVTADGQFESGERAIDRMLSSPINDLRKIPG